MSLLPTMIWLNIPFSPYLRRPRAFPARARPVIASYRVPGQRRFAPRVNLRPTGGFRRARRRDILRDPTRQAAMTDLPTHVDIHEEGPREGFQIEPGPISTADKIKLIEALAETGLHHIQSASFVSPRIVPGWADAEDVVAGFTPKDGVHYTALWFNPNGLNRALIFRNKLTVSGSIALTASEAFTQKNLHRSHAE